MALIECKECGHKVSDEAKTCPSCGVKVPQPPGRLKVLFWGLVIIFTLKAIFGGGESSHSSYTAVSREPQKTSEDERNEKLRWDLLHESMKTIKESLRDPQSLQVEKAIVQKSGETACIQYRAKNGFGGYERNTAVIANNSATNGTPALIKKHCSENMHDMTDAAKLY